MICARVYPRSLNISILSLDMNSILHANLLREAARLASDGELGNSDAIRLLQMPHSVVEIKEVLRRFENQLTREARAKLIREVFAPLPEHVDNQRFEPLFEKYPISGRTYTTESGTVVLNEIQYYNGEMLHFYGECGNVAQVSEELAGSGHKPILLNCPNGKQTALVQVWANKLTDTSLRPYNSMFIVIPAVPQETPAHLAALSADGNGASSLLSMLRGSYDAGKGVYENAARLYFVRLFDSTQIAIDVGRERMGTDKRPGNTELKRDGRLVDLSITDKYGRLMTRGRLILAEDSRAYLPAVAKAASTAGIAFNPMPAGTEYVFQAIARIECSPCISWQWRTDVLPRYQPLTGDALLFGTSSEEGVMLNGWGFQPKVLGYIPNVRGAITGVPEHSTTGFSGEHAAKTVPPTPTVQTVESSVSRLLLPAPWTESRLGARYWRRSC
jgi:hypothetical protein